ncbi:MAG: DUF4256 family protein [Clostridia bacterium]|nr:DUF4256 family protein [Clostridia bacterium]
MYAIVECLHVRKGDIMAQNQWNTVDEYIMQFPDEVQEILRKLRQSIKEAAPEAEEKISYQMPTYYFHGNLVHFAAYKKHIGFYPAPSGVEAFQKELSVYKGAKGSVQFPISDSIPFALIKRIVEFRVKENMPVLSEKHDEIMRVLKARFNANMTRHKGIEWEAVKSKIIANDEKMRALYAMEATGGEPDVISFDNSADEFVFVDCSAQTPTKRRNVCYDREALEKRKENKPDNNAVDMSHEMGIEILSEDQYRMLQEFGAFDTKSSSWVKTPDHIRKLGGAIFCDRRYDTIFVYHNSAESYYSVRGFRGFLKV